MVWLVALLALLDARFARAQEVNGQVYGFVSFSTERVEAREDSGNAVTTVQLPLVRELGTTGTVLATVQVSAQTMCSILTGSTDRLYVRSYIELHVESYMYGS